MLITVPAQFPIVKNCKIAWVGEAPGDYEMVGDPITKVRRPLIGPSGKLHNSMLKSAGIERTECLTTNVFNTQLPENDVTNWCASTVEAREWSSYDLPAIAQKGSTKYYLRPEYIPHLDRLAEEIAQVNPNVIVCLGGTALWAFTGFHNITTRRGAVHEATMVGEGKKILPTFHAAHLLQGAHNMKPLVVMDYIKALSESSTPKIETTEREIWIEPRLDDLWDFRDKYLDDAPYISVDIETPYLKAGIPKYFRQMKCIGFADGPHHAIVVPFINDGDSTSYWKTVSEEVEAKQFVKEICKNEKPKILQNGAAFDLHWLWDRYRIELHNHTFDTRLEHHVIYPELPKSLQVLGSLYARERSWKTMRANVLKRDE